MARPLRLEYPGAVWHLTACGNERKRIFRSVPDYLRFDELLGEAARRYKWIVYAYVLMSNHTHLVIETPEETLSRGMQWLNGKYAQWFNDWSAWKNRSSAVITRVSAQGESDVDRVVHRARREERERVCVVCKCTTGRRVHGDSFDIADEQPAFGGHQLTALDFLPNRACDLREKEVGGLESIFGDEQSGGGVASRLRDEPFDDDTPRRRRRSSVAVFPNQRHALRKKDRARCHAPVGGTIWEWWTERAGLGWARAGSSSMTSYVRTCSAVSSPADVFTRSALRVSEVETGGCHL
jgi:REP element-mobilizing transposase RayT